MSKLNSFDQLAPLTDTDLATSLSLLDELQSEVRSESSHLGAPTRSSSPASDELGNGPKDGLSLGVGDETSPGATRGPIERPGSALESLRATRIGFGNPNNELIRLTPKLFDDLGLELAEIQRRQMRDRFDFYYLSLTLSLQPRRGAQFRLVECRLSFAPEAEDSPIVHALFPTGEWRDVLSFGTQMTLALDADLQWRVGLPEPAREDLPIQLKAKVGDQAKLGAYVVAPRSSYQIGRNEIVAAGLGTDTCFWRLENPDLRRTFDVPFRVVLKLPKGSGGVRLSALATAEPSMNWLAADLRHVWDALSERFRRLLQLDDDQRQGAERLPIGAQESWNLELRH